MNSTVETSQYLTFTLDDEQYAVDVARVREVLDVVPITRIAQTQDYMKGVINIRGSVVPVADLRLKLAVDTQDETEDSSIIVMEVMLDGAAQTVGCLTDSVQEVVSIEASSVEPPPRVGTAIDGECILGIGKRGDRLIVILDIDRVFAGEGSTIAAARSSAAE